ncbi:MAG TPA: hypothetical protein VFP61_00805 [Acidimicrobiales bacterium]|nr:hypothetical protein [Acidimicrobiales bacterium]
MGAAERASGASPVDGPVDVVLAGCRATDELDPGAGAATYPSTDHGPLVAALERRGATWAVAAWDDPRVDWSLAGRVLLSATWDSVDRPAEFLDWVRRVSTVASVVNPPTVVEWNLDKRHHRDLAGAGVPVVPTTWLEPPEADASDTAGTQWAPDPAGPHDLVIKPSVSAGGRATARFDTSVPAQAEAAVAHVAGLHGAGQAAMVQPYVAAVDDPGEIDLVFIGGGFSHAVRKLPVLVAGAAVPERPWERTAWAGVADPTSEELAVAEGAVAAASRLLGCRLAYARVDLAGGWVLELEAIDPLLSFDLVPEAADRLAALLV